MRGTANRLGLGRAAALAGLTAGVFGCEGGYGPGNLLASQGLCDNVVFGDDPRCNCCGARARGCTESSECAPEGASKVCGARCPADMVCNPTAAASSAYGPSVGYAGYGYPGTGYPPVLGACQRLRSSGESCAAWGVQGSESNCSQDLACLDQGYLHSPYYADYRCRSCHKAGEWCGSDSTPCCGCAGLGMATCQENTCVCPSPGTGGTAGTGGYGGTGGWGGYAGKGGTGGYGAYAGTGAYGGYAGYGASGTGGSVAWTAPPCPADSGYPCTCSGNVCADDSPCVKFGGATGLCVKPCSPTGSSSECYTQMASPDAVKRCAFELQGTGGSTFYGCLVRCTDSSQCPQGETCTTTPNDKVCLP